VASWGEVCIEASVDEVLGYARLAWVWGSVGHMAWHACDTRFRSQDFTGVSVSKGGPRVSFVSFVCCCSFRLVRKCSRARVYDDEAGDAHNIAHSATLIA